MKITIEINSLGDGKVSPLEQQSDALERLMHMILEGYIEGELYMDSLDKDAEYGVRSWFKVNIEE